MSLGMTGVYLGQVRTVDSRDGRGFFCWHSCFDGLRNQFDQLLTLDDGRCLLNSDQAYHPRLGRSDRMLHLHRLDNDELLAGAYLVANGDLELPHGAL